MVVTYSKALRKMYRRLRPDVRMRFKSRRNTFLREPLHPLLNNHQLHGEYAGCRSINVTGDYRAIFYRGSKNVISFIAIGTHHELFGS